MLENQESSFNRESALNESFIILKKIQARLTMERFKEHETDNAYLKMLRGYTALLSVVNQVSKDMELQELERRVKAIEESK